MHVKSGQTEQGNVTVVTAIRPERLGALQAVLSEIAAQLPPVTERPAPGPFPFRALGTVHYLRWIILPETRDACGAPIGPELVMVSCFDGSPIGHLDEMVHVAGDSLLEIYGHCEGAPEPGNDARRRLVAYLTAHVVPPAAYYIANRHRTARQIVDEAVLHRTLERVLDGHIERKAEPSIDEIVGGLRAHVRDTPHLRWALTPPPGPSWRQRLSFWGRLVGIAVGALLASPVLLPIGLVVLAILRRAERGIGTSVRAPIYGDTPAGLAHLARLSALEDFEVQNGLTHVSPLRPGRFKLFTLRVVCRLLQFRADYIDTQGSFGGITSIHFAHWTVIDGGRRLLFCTNYDGTWESYLDQFIDRAASALTAVWSHCIDFPRTRLLMIGGARDEERFKSWFRSFQVPTTVWYAAYPHLSVQNIQNNTAIRIGLEGPLDQNARLAWLKRL